MEHLLTYREMIDGGLTLPISKNTDEDKVNICIKKAEDIIRDTIGDNLFIDILKDENEFKYHALLHGCQYEEGICTGLKVACAYYTYANLVYHSDSNVTRYGFTAKNDDNSSRVSYQEREIIRKDALAYGDRYLLECKKYMIYKGFISKHNDIHLRRNGRAKINILGE